MVLRFGGLKHKTLKLEHCTFNNFFASRSITVALLPGNILVILGICPMTENHGKTYEQVTSISVQICDY